MCFRGLLEFSLLITQCLTHLLPILPFSHFFAIWTLFLLINRSFFAPLYFDPISPSFRPLAASFLIVGDNRCCCTASFTALRIPECPRAYMSRHHDALLAPALPVNVDPMREAGVWEYQTRGL